MALLKALVIGMGVLIVGAMGLLAYGLITKTGGSDTNGTETAPTAITDIPLAAFGDIVIPDAATCRIDDARTSGQRLTLTLGGSANCRRVVLVDLGTGVVIGQIRLSPASP